MPRGKVSPRRAAKMLGRHLNSVYGWCRAAERGQPSKFRNIERDPRNGYFLIDLDEIERLQDEDE